MNFEKIIFYLLKILPGFIVTLNIMVMTLIFGMIFGIILTILKLSRNKVVRKLAFGFTSIMRGSPALITLFIMFYGLPVLTETLFNINIYNIDKSNFAIFTMTLYCASMLSENMRAAYEAIPKGQMEAAISIGESYVTAIRRIILPQAFLIMLPNLGNIIIELMKDASLAYSIGVIDAIGKVNILKMATSGKYAVEMYIGVTLMFWIMSVFVTIVFNIMENKFSKHKRA